MMNYSQGKGDYENWVVSEVEFSPDALGKSEAIMYLGNGYMGLQICCGRAIHKRNKKFVCKWYI